jgi:serine/threonine-protein kinase RsbW
MPEEKKQPDIIRIKIPSDPKYVSTVRAMVEDLARKSGFDKTKIEDLKLAINEALANVILHAYSGLKNKVIFLYIIVHPNLLEIIIKDFGKKLDIRNLRSRDLMDFKEDGLGVFLIKNMVDEVIYTSQSVGTELKLVKNK